MTKLREFSFAYYGKAGLDCGYLGLLNINVVSYSAYGRNLKVNRKGGHILDPSWA